MYAKAPDKESRRLLDYLMLNSGNFVNDGLYYGKMGFVLTLCEYAARCEDDVYLDLAGELLDEILNDIHTESPIGLANGLCGIGWGVEYLIRNSYMEGNPDEILAEIDAFVMRIDIHRVEDFSIETGLGGIACYVATRLTALDRNGQEAMPFDSLYLDTWKKWLVMGLQKNLTKEVDEIFADLRQILNAYPNIAKRGLPLPAFIDLTGNERTDLPLLLQPKGLNGGLAGQLLWRIRQ